MGELIILIVMAMQVEAVWETLKMLWQEGKFSYDRIGALCIGLIIAFGARLELNNLIGITIFVPMLDIVLTGILISRGSNFIHDLLIKLQGDVGE